MFQQIELGAKVKSVAIERFKAVENVTDVIAVISRKIAATNCHYAPQTGYFYCFKGECCRDLGLPSQRYILPVVRYTLENLKLRKYGLPVTLHYWALAKAGYEQEIAMKEEIHGDITHVDMAVSCEDANFQKNKYEVVGPAAWRANKEIYEVVKELFAEYQNLIEMSCARTLTPETFLKLMLEEAPDRVPDHNSRGSAGKTGRRPLSLHGSTPPASRIENTPARELLDPPNSPPATVKPAAQPTAPAPSAPGTGVPTPEEKGKAIEVGTAPAGDFGDLVKDL